MRKGLLFILFILGIGAVTQLFSFIKKQGAIDVIAGGFIIVSLILLTGFYIRMRNENA